MCDKFIKKSICNAFISRPPISLSTTLCWLVGWLCWGLTSQSTIFQSYRDGAIASWVINQYFRGVKCLAQGHNTAAVGLEPRTSRSGVRHSTTEPPRSPQHCVVKRNMLRRHPVVLKETRTESGGHEGECHGWTGIYSFPALNMKTRGMSCNPLFIFPINEWESNLKPDSQLYSRNPFCPGARVIDILPFWWNANNFLTSWEPKMWNVSTDQNLVWCLYN